VILGGMVLGASGLSAGALARPAQPGALPSTEFARIEAETGGRLGVFVHDLEHGRQYQHRATERFPMCSTFKVLASAAILSRVDAGRERLDRVVRFTSADMVAYSPVTEQRMAGGMTVAELCEAAVTRSDNTAGNLLLDSLGGPGAITAYARSLGDQVTRLDRTETSLNEARPGDPRDTTSPASMSHNLRALVLGQALSEASRNHLVSWLVVNQTGDTRLRAGLPKNWRVGDKTGSGDNGTANDVAVVWRPDQAPLIICAYLTGSNAPAEKRNAALAEVARVSAAILLAGSGGSTR